MVASWKRVPILALLGASCTGVKFTPTPMNVAMPADMLQRTALLNFAAYPSNMGALAGHLLFVRKEGGACPSTIPSSFSSLDVSIQSFVLNGEELKPTPTATPRYESKVDRGASTSGKATVAVATIAASLNTEQTAEILVSDVDILVRDDQLDLPALKAIAAKPLPNDVCERIFIRGAALETYIYKDYVHIDASATTAGGAFGADGKVFSSDQRFAQAYGIGLELQRLTDLINGPGPTIATKWSAPAAISSPDRGFPIRALADQ